MTSKTPSTPPRPRNLRPRPHLAELDAALSAYDRHGNFTCYVSELTEVLGYTQKNGFASRTLVSPTGAEFDIPGRIGKG